jgi:signal transduction histidine kinase
MTTVTKPVDAVGSPSAPVAPREGVPLVAGLALVALVLAGIGLAGSADDGVALGDVVRAGLIAAWALAGLFLVIRAARSTGIIVLAVAALAAVCSATADQGAVTDVIHRLALGLLPAAGLHLLLALPDGRLGTPGRRSTARAGYAIGLVVGVALALADAPPPWWPVVVEGAAVAVVGIPASNLRYRQVHGSSRQRLQWLGLAVAIAVEASLVLLALNLFVDWPPHAAELVAATTVLVPLGLAAGASRHLVTSVDRLLVHVVSAAGLTAVVVAVYLVIVLGLGRAPDDDERSLLILSMVAAAVAALLYLPARTRLADAANRLVYGERAAPDEALRSFGSRLSRAVPMDELLLQLAESLKKTMALRAAEVWTGGAERLDRVVSVPDRPAATFAPGDKERPVLARAGVVGNAWLAVWAPSLLEGRDDVQLRIAPACHSGEILGLLVAERPADGDLFTDEDDRVLTELARQVGLALHNVALDSALQASLDEVRRQAEALRASRARLVATADAERRKIERNLHDGAQQHLVAMAVNLRLAKDIVAEDPDSAVELLDALADSVKDTIQELRDLAHGIYPPLLMDSGLAEALRAAAGRSPLDVSVAADGLGRYTTEVEAAVYFCCLEALQNAAKHAPGSHVVITLSETDGALGFEVADDGPGFDAATAKAGHGFVNMSDRLGAIGGSVDWNSALGDGTRIVGSVPVGGGVRDSRD